MRQIILFLVCFATSQVVQSQSLFDRYQELERRADDAHMEFMKSFQESYKDMREYETMDTDKFIELFVNWLDRIIERDTFLKENYRELIPQVGWMEGVQILRIVDTFDTDGYKNKDRRNELLLKLTRAYDEKRAL